MQKFWRMFAIVFCSVAVLCPTYATAKTRLAFKSARQASTYYVFAVGQANAIQAGAPEIEITVEDSPGSMVNVKESKTRDNFLFTSPTTVIETALKSEGEFTEGGYDGIRALWPIPGIVMHWVVREDSGVTTLRELAGKKFIPGGAGSAGAQVTAQVLEMMGIKDQVELQLVDLNEGVQAVQNRQAVGFATASAIPATMVSEIAATSPVRLLSLEDADYANVAGSLNRAIIPAGIYKGVDADVKTVSQLVGVYTLASLPEDVAYQVTKAFWEQREIWEKSHPAMQFIKMDDVNALRAQLHPGALRYYTEIGFAVADTLK